MFSLSDDGEQDWLVSNSSLSLSFGIFFWIIIGVGKKRPSADFTSDLLALICLGKRVEMES